MFSVDQERGERKKRKERIRRKDTWNLPFQADKIIKLEIRVII